ncbi:InlB B-repeat-containing protein, partial [Archangium sp.]|uniref:InlB B-repeat-containing protein n=1 Tax=Archangium sp. TaxID=1872627 RepID=UPI002ED84E4C
MNHSKFLSPSKRAAPVLAPRPGHRLSSVVAACFLGILAACSEERSSLENSAQGLHDSAPPYWDGGTGPAVHHPPVSWPAEPVASECGVTCGEWLPYTRFQNALNDPRTKDPSNGGTSPQNHVNIASSCVDKALPSVYYALHKHPTDPTKDVLLFRWRVGQDAHTYATGPSAGTFRSGDPWSSALWTVLFNLDGSGYRTLAAHINGSAGSPSAPVDTLAGIYGKIPTQSINYLDDPANIKLLGTQPTAFVDEGTERLLNFTPPDGTAAPKSVWGDGSVATVWDYGTTRAQLVTNSPCTEYFIDYQIPVAMLDASAHGGPKVTRSTPISMLFCTANSLNNPFQKDCALNRKWTANTNTPGPFGDFISFDKDDSYAQPLITAVTAKAPSTCADTYELTAKVQDALWVNSQEVVEPSVKKVSFWYYHDRDLDGVSDDGSTWRWAADGTLASGKLNEWRARWDSRDLPRGNYLIGVQAVDDNTRLDDGMTPTGIDNRTFSYVTSDSLGQVYIGGSWHIDTANFPGHFPVMTPQASENWYGNPLITGVQVAGTGVDLALNTCGVAPTLGMTGTPGELIAGDSVNFTITVGNPSSTTPLDVSRIVGELPPGFSYVNGTTSGPFGSANPVVSGSTLTWNFSPVVTVGTSASLSLTFKATAGSVVGSYNAQAKADTISGTITSNPVPLTVYSARASLTQAPSRYSVKADGVTQVKYTLTYANESSVTLSNATLTNPLPANVKYESCTGGTSCSFSGGQVTWPLGTLAAGTKGSVTFNISVTPAFTASSLTNVATLQATVPGGSPLQRSSTSTIAVERPVPVFSLSMTSSVAVVNPGGSVTWTLTYENQGDGSADGSLLVSALPAGFTFVNASCSFTGSAHFKSCTHSNGTVEFRDAGGARVAVGPGGKGSVSFSATAAAAPFTHPNPGVNRATLSPLTGPGAAQAQSSVGVSGDYYCNNTFYFRRGVDNQQATVRPASLNPPTDSTPYSTLVTATSEYGATADLTFLQEPAFPQQTAIGGLTPTLILYLTVPQGGGQMHIDLYKVNTTTNARTLISQTTPVDFSLGNGSATLITHQLPAVAAGTTVQSTEKLQWVIRFKANGGTRNITLHYDSLTEQSRSAFCPATAPANLSLSNTVDKLRISGAVEKLTYTLSYANVGSSSASNVVLTDDLPAGMTACEYSIDSGSTWQACSAAASSPQRHVFSLGALAAGATGTVQVRGNSPASPTSGQPLVNTATLTSNETSPLSATASTTITGSALPMLTITGAADKVVVGPGGVVTYTFQVENVGTGTATNVAVSNAIPATSWYQYVAGSITGGVTPSASGSNLSWPIGTLPAGSTATLSFRMVVSATGLPSGLTALDDFATVSDSSSCTGASRPASCTSNTVTVLADGNANLTLSSSGTPTSVVPGLLIEYTLTVGSAGSSTATGVVLSDSLPPYTRFESITQGSGSYDVGKNQVNFSLGDLAPGQTRELKFRVRVDNSLPGRLTPLVNKASVSASNAQLRESTVATSVERERMSLISSGPASLPGPAAQLAASASNTTTLKVNSSALLEVGGYLSLNGTVARITGIAGTTVTVASPVNGSMGDKLWRSAAYTVSYANNGNAGAESVVVTSHLPAGWLYVGSFPEANAKPGVGTTGSVSWNLGSVAARESSSLQVVAIPTRTDTLPSEVVDFYSCPSATRSDCSDSVTTQVGGLSVTKSTSTPVVSAGGTATYTITVENSLNTSVEGISVTDLLPSGFRYQPGSSTLAPTSVHQGGQPTWSGLAVTMGAPLVLTFKVDVDVSTGTGTYNNELSVVAPTGVGVTPFDALSTTAEDVTVLDAKSFVVAGHVFRDRPALGVHDNDDTGLEGVVVEVNGGPTLGLFSTQTDGFGYFQRILRTGTTETWKVSIPTGASNQNVLNGLVLYSAYSTPVDLNPSSPAATSLRFGYIPTAEATYTVSTEVTAGGSVSSPSSAKVTHGKTATFTVTPDTGYVVQSVTGCGGTLSGTTYTTAAVTGDCTVSVSFIREYTVSTEVTAGGSISPGSAKVVHGGTTFFTVTPDTGYVVQSVTGCGGTLAKGVYTTAEVTEDCTVSVSFIKEYTVSTEVTAGGSISPGSAKVVHGGTTFFTVTPDTGYVVQSVTGCGGTLAKGVY